jgi:hypothetical protein
MSASKILTEASAAGKAESNKIIVAPHQKNTILP